MFRLFGFPVHIRVGFLLFLGLVVFLNRGEFGYWLAGALAIFTLVHELGHAVAARMSGAHAEISLDFMAGYTSFRPRKRLSVSRRIFITAAGPAVHIATSLAVLAAMGINPFSLSSVTGSGAAGTAIFWAGPIIGAINLIPVVPLDGGHILMAALEPLIGKRAQRVTIVFSIMVTLGVGAYLIATGRPNFSIFLIFLLFGQFSMYQGQGRSRPSAGGSVSDNALHQAVQAEGALWSSDVTVPLAKGQVPSPWNRAYTALQDGQVEAARAIIIGDLRAEREKNWAVPLGVPKDKVKQVVDILPHDLPVGEFESTRCMIEVLLHVDENARAGEYAAAAYAVDRNPTFAILVAIASARLGQIDNALAWAQSSVDAAATISPDALTSTKMYLRHSPSLDSLRERPEFQTMLQRDHGG